MTGEESGENHLDHPRRASSSVMGALAGTAGAAVGLGFGELIEGVSESIPSLVVAVSELISDYTPGDVVRFSIANFGANQKTLLAAGIVTGALVLGGVLGRFAAQGRLRAALTGFALFGLLGGWAVARNPLSPAAGSWVVGLAAAALAAATTLLLAGRIAGRSAQAPATLPVDPDRPDPGDGAGAARGETTTRRAFFVYVTGTGAAALAMVGLGRALRGQSAAEQFLEANTLRSAPASTTTSQPSPTTVAATAPASTTVAATAPASTNEAATAPASTTEAATAPTTSTTAPAQAEPSVREQVAGLDTLDDVAGISSYVTPNDSFYRIDTAFGREPQVDPASWRLRFTGMVDNPYEITFDEIQAMDLSDHVITLSCVSNRVGGNLVGNAVWTGVPLSVLLDRAGVQPGASQVVGRSVDDWTAGFPTPVVYDGRNAILAIGMNDEFLPTDHGFPARLVVAGLYGYVSAVKWLEEIHLTTWDGFDGYWVPRGWSKEGPMKTQSRIDVPAAGQGLVAGQLTPIAGIAWAPTRGIERVEVSVDGGDWLPCELGEALGDESWVQWHREWTPTAGRHQIQVRATDGDGITQSSREVDPAPNGAEGWHTVTVNV